MKNRFVFTNQCLQQFQSLEPKQQNRIRQKLDSLTGHPDLFSVLLQLKGYEPASHRLRIGNLRAILRFQAERRGVRTFIIIKVAPRRDIYR